MEVGRDRHGFFWGLLSLNPLNLSHHFYRWIEIRCFKFGDILTPTRASSPGPDKKNLGRPLSSLPGPSGCPHCQRARFCLLTAARGTTTKLSKWGGCLCAAVSTTSSHRCRNGGARITQSHHGPLLTLVHALLVGFNLLGRRAA
jgi:hypothetical protein